MFLANVTGDRRIPLIGVDQVIAEDRKFINISLSEPQRVQAVLIANQRGGDGEPIVLDVSPSTFVDVAQNPNLNNIMLILEEFPDDIPPRVLKCSIDYNVGNLFIFTNEIIDVTPSALLNLSLISLVQSNISTNEVTLFGAKTTAIDSQVLTIKLTESQRIFGYTDVRDARWRRINSFLAFSRVCPL